MTRKCHVRFGGRPMEKAPHGDLASGLPDFQDEEGKDRGMVEIVASDVQFLGRRSTAPKADSFPDPDEASPDELPDDRPF